MTIAFWCVLAAAFLPFPFTLAAKWSRRFDNARPRAYFETVEGWRQRAHWTQLNSFEAFPAFAAAVIVNHLVLGANGRADALALAFIGFRLLYGLCYLADKATLRSLMWLAASGCVIALFVSAA
ncbi:MAG: MAPEG family protein [Stagnimonas sp.]|nr:MAPEG family protein [Stagnimonas sp.]